MTDKNLINIEINNIVIKAKSGDRLIDIADANGIDIPRFCYHKKLSVAANCRMCLVEVENAPKPMPACATVAMDGMKIFTKSEKALNSQKSVLEFLLINHPLDCPICDQGGECDLQDLAVAYGNDFSRFNEPKRIVQDKNLGSLVSTDMTRCIHCTRCVRFGEEIAGVVEMGGLGRGEHMEIGTYIEQSLTSELSGNMIDLCPVGALTSKPFRFQARNWELQNTESIAPHDALGSNIIIQSINDKIVRVLPNDNEAINEIWLSDQDRFSYLGLYTKDRLETPMLRNKHGVLEPISWQNALEITAVKLQEEIDKNQNSMGVLMSPNSTTEEFYLLNKMTNALEIDNISCRLRHANISNITTSMSCKIADIDNMEAILIIGSDIQQEVPLLAHRIKKANRKGADIHAANVQMYPSSFKTTTETHSATEMLARLDGILSYLTTKEKVSKDTRSVATALENNKNTLLLLGQVAITSTVFKTIYQKAQKIAELTHTKIALVDIGANTKGAMAAGLYDKTPKTLLETLKTSKTLLLFGTELGLDSGIAVDNYLAQQDFIIACSSYLSDELKNHASIIFPMANFGETSGTFVNIQNDWQSFKGAVPPLGDARPGWKILRVLANHFDLSGFDFISSSEVLAECQNNIKNPEIILNDSDTEFKPVATIPIYATDALVRHSDALQQIQTNRGLNK